MLNHFYMDYLGQSRYVGILQYVYEGITFYFIDNESYFCGPKPYGDWYFDLEKFSFFCQAALSALPVIGFQPDVVHCHDWQTGLIPVFDQAAPYFEQASLVLVCKKLYAQPMDPAGL